MRIKGLVRVFNRVRSQLQTGLMPTEEEEEVPAAAFSGEHSSYTGDDSQALRPCVK